MFISKRIVSIFACITLMVAGCSSSNKDVQQASINPSKKASKIKELYIQFNADKNLNLDQNNQPLSLMVRIYQLKDNRVFLQDNYKDLLKEKNENLKQDTLVQYDIPLKPKDKILVHRPMENNTIYIGIVAFFRKPDLQKNNWRIIINRERFLKKKPRILDVSANTLTLKLTKKELKLEKKEQEKRGKK